MNKRQLLAAAGGLIASALIGGALISSVLASPGAGADSGTDSVDLGDGEYCDVYLDALAAELGVERTALGAASKAAMNGVIDAALADGEIDEERAAEARERIAELDDGECEAFRPRIGGHGYGGHRGHGPGPFHGRGFGVLQNAAEAAADALGMEQDELVAAFREGSSLQELAEAQDVAYDGVTTAVTDAVRAELEDAVADQDITQERADRVLDRLGEWLDDGGEPRRHGPRGAGGSGG